ncbi:MAG: nucleotide sugar dehydrogenase [Bacilli bacterium]|nr:nucleotide sugar dehydrogenase [Bacilli bacterium]
MKIAVAGIGYVGLSNAVLLNQRHDVVAFDIDEKKIAKVKNGECPFSDNLIPQYLAENPLKVTSDTSCYEGCDFILIAAPTDYDPEKEFFDTSKVEDVIEKASKVNKDAVYVIKSTVPIGYTETIKKRTGLKIVFSPEFLRETKALEDNLHPSRIVVGCDKELEKEAGVFASLLKEASLNEDTKILICGSSEAESIKLFANTYLALRISFFNELDTFAKTKGLNTKEILEGICLDNRIGNFYNNPSFGYGGYCLPKDTKQLKANYASIPENLISAIVSSNDTRKDFIAQEIIKKAKQVSKNPTIGIYRMTMKTGADNLRASSMIDIYQRLVASNMRVVVYEPYLAKENQYEIKTEEDFDKFISMCDLIAANRIDEKISKSGKNVYTSDLFGID